MQFFGCSLLAVFICTFVTINFSNMIKPSRTFVRKISIERCIEKFRSFFPLLSTTSYKGQQGRVAVIGGSPIYTGAPYYAAQSSLNYGAELSFVFCDVAASLSIKSYSPEIMVVPVDFKKLWSSNSDPNYVSVVTNYFPRIHSMVVGPGLGREPATLAVVATIIRQAIENRIPLVIDADGLFLVAQDISIIRNCSRCVLTPNGVEFTKLVESAIMELENDGLNKPLTTITDNTASILSRLRSLDIAIQIQALAQFLGGVTVLRKGEFDMISSGDDVLVVHAKEFHLSPRRCGGQGDILAGILGVNIFWATQRHEIINTNSIFTTELYDENLSASEKCGSKINLDSFLHGSALDCPIDLIEGYNVSRLAHGEITTGLRHSGASSPDDLLSAPSSAEETLMSNFRPSETSVNASFSEKQAINYGAVLSALVVKRASSRAFFEKNKRRSMGSPDVMNEIGSVVYDYFDSVASSSAT